MPGKDTSMSRKKDNIYEILQKEYTYHQTAGRKCRAEVSLSLFPLNVVMWYAKCSCVAVWHDRQQAVIPLLFLLACDVGA